MAFPEAATFVLCVCQHAELCVSLASHHPAHPAQPTARDPACGIPQAPRAPCSTEEACSVKRGGPPVSRVFSQAPAHENLFR